MTVDAPKGINVSSILDKFHDGDNGEYDLLCAIVSGVVPVKPSQMTEILLQLRECIIKLDILAGKLIKAILNVKLDRLEARGLVLFGELVIAVTGINTAYHTPAVNTCVQRFGFVTNNEMALEEKLDSVAMEEKDLDPFGPLAHELLHRLMQVYPTMSHVTLQVLDDRWPREDGPPNLYLEFFRNMCVLYIHAPAIRNELLPKMMDRLIKLDVLVQKEDQTTKNKPNETMFAMEDTAQQSSISLVELIDLCLQYFLVMLRDHCSQNQDIALETLELLTCYCEDGSIGSAPLNFIPFVYLYFLSLHEEWLPVFLKRMWSASSGTDKMCCRRSHRRVTFMAALLARANFASKKLALHWLKEWVNWAESYLNLCPENKVEGCLSHGMFYSVCRAIFLLTTFRFNDLIGKNKKGLHELNLERLTHSRLNPLRFTPKHLVTAFANITRSAQLVYCYHVIERNRRLQMYDQNSDTKQFVTDNYFPLDPCTLTRYSTFVSGLYRDNEIFAKESVQFSDSDEKWNAAKRDRMKSTCSDIETMDFIVESVNNNDKDMGLFDEMIDYGSSPGLKSANLMNLARQMCDD